MKGYRYKTEHVFTWALVIMGASRQASPPLCPQGFHRDYLSTQTYLKHVLPSRESLPVICLMSHSLLSWPGPLCSTLATVAYFSLLKKCSSFIIKDEAAPGKENCIVWWPAHRACGQKIGLEFKVSWSYFASVVWFGNLGEWFLTSLFHSAFVRLQC